MTRAELIEALETAQGADSIYSTCGMICDAWDMRIESDPAFKRFAIENAEKFSRFLTANAYLDAAMMLVPDMCLHMVRTVWADANKPNEQTAGYASVDRYYRDDSGLWWKENFLSTAATPALALAAACLRAGGE